MDDLLLVTWTLLYMLILTLCMCVSYFGDVANTHSYVYFQFLIQSKHMQKSFVAGGDLLNL